MRLDVERFLEDVTGRYAGSYAEAVQDMLVATAQGDDTAEQAARERLGKIIAETMGVGEVLGASLMLREAAEVYASDDPTLLQADTTSLIRFAKESTQDVLPRITFQEAVQDMIERTPVTIRRAAERTAARIMELYSNKPTIAFARAAEAAVTKRAQALIVESMKKGLNEVQAGRKLTIGVNEIRKRTKLWTEGYARMAFRTNLNSAVTAGRFRQARDPDIGNAIPAMMFVANHDSDVRENHEKLDGVILKVDNPAWNKIAPPLGYNCRCRVVPMSVPMLRRANALGPNGTVRETPIPNGGPDPGFRREVRPDLAGVPKA